MQSRASVQADIPGFQRHEFSVSLTTGQLLRLTLTEKRLDLGLQIFDPSGALVARSDRHPVWKESISYQAAASGVYRVSVAAQDVDLTGAYNLQCAIDGQANAEQRLRMEAGRLSQEGWDLRDGSSAADAQKAIDLAQKSRALWEQVGDQDEIAYSLTLAAIASRYIGQHQRTVALADEAIRLFQKRSNPAGEAAALRAKGVAQALESHFLEALESFQRYLDLAKQTEDIDLQARGYGDLGPTYVTLGRFDDATSALENCVALSRKIKLLRTEAGALSNLAGLKIRQGRYEESIPFSERSVAIYQQLKKPYFEGIALLTLGQSFEELGDYKKALEIYEQSLQIRRGLQDPDGIGTSLEYIASIYVETGRYEEAIARIEEAQSIRRTTDHRMNEILPLISLGKIYEYTGRFDKSQALYQQALTICQQEQQQEQAAVVLGNMADLYNQLRQDDLAIDYAKRGLELDRATGATDRATVALATLGEIYARSGRLEEANRSLEDMLTSARRSGSKDQEATALMRLSDVRLLAGNWQASEELLKQALPLTREVQDPNLEASAVRELGKTYIEAGRLTDARSTLNQALAIYRRLKADSDSSNVLTQIATLEQKAGNLTAGLAAIEESLRLSESQRARLYNPRSRMSWFTVAQEANGRYIDVLMDLHKKDAAKGYNTLAFEAAERGRARGLLDVLRESGQDFTHTVKPELVDEEKHLGQQIDALESQRMKLILAKRSSGVLALDRQIEDLRTECERVEGEIRSSSPRYAQVTQAPHYTLAQIQAELDDDTQLLEYSLGKDRSFCWLVGQHEIQSFELPASAVVQASAKRVYDLITARGRLGANPAMIKAADGSFHQALTELTQILLGPASKSLKKNRIAVVTDGALDYIPFSLLDESSSSASYLPLVVKHEIVSLPSASTLAVLRQQLAGRVTPPKTIAIFADPVFALDDRRMGRKTPEAAASPTVSNEDTRMLVHLSETGPIATTVIRIPRLAFTRKEASRIIAMVPSAQRLDAIGFRATREMAMSPELGEYRYLHFATHGWLDSENPERSSLVLSLVDRQGRPQDGFLRAGDIYKLRLPAELVTLSACQTGLGKQITGEGMIGLTRSFLYAGAARVVVSDWNVNDEATADLMGAFYTHMLERGERPSAALRAAQLESLHSKHWQSPYYWAAFTLHGEWR